MPQITDRQSVFLLKKNLVTKSRSSFSRFYPIFLRLRLNKLSLRAKIVLFVLIIGILPIMGFEVIIYHLVSQSNTREIIRNKREKTYLLANRVNSFLLRRYTDIQLISDSLTIELNNSNDARNRAQIQLALANFLNEEKNTYTYRSIVVLDLNGNSIAESTGELIPNQKDEEDFQAVLKSGYPYISQSLTNNLDSSNIYITTPVKNGETGQTIYIIRAVVSLNSLKDVLTTSQKNRDNYIIADALGKILLCNQDCKLGINIKNKFPELRQIQAKNKGKDINSFSTEINNREIITYLGLPRVKGMPNFNWVILLDTPKVVEFSIQRRLLLALEISIFITVLLVIGIGAVLAERLSQPVKATVKTIEKLSQGDLSTRIILRGEDELATMVFHINHMANQLQDLLQKQTNEAERLRLLANTLQIIRSSLNSPDLFNTTVTEVRSALKVDRVLIYQFNAHSSGQIIAESVETSIPRMPKELIEDSYIGPEIFKAFENDNDDFLAINNVHEVDFSPENLKLLEQLNIKACLVIPILKENERFGFLVAHHCYSTHFWQPYEINFLQQLAVQVGLTLERVTLLEASQTLKDFAIRLSETLNPQDIYNLTVQEIQKAVKAERVVIYKFDNNEQGSIIAESVVADWPSILKAEIQESCWKDCMEKYRQGLVYAVNDIYQADLSECDIQQLEAYNVKAKLTAPILLGDQLLGLLIVHQCSQPRVWQRSDIDLCEQSARIVGIALERSHLFEQTQKERVAAEIVSQQQRQQKEQLQLQLLQLLNQIEAVSRGKLTVRAEVTSGEIGTIAAFFNSIVENLQEIIISVKDAATQLDEAITEKSEAFSQLAITALQQSEQINHTLESVDQMQVSIAEVSQTAQQAAAVTSTASDTAQTGGQTMELTVESIMCLRQTMEETTKKVKLLGESLQQISHVVALINQISMQTNLLAVNTSIEAARAGEEAQGFVVIAEEVAILADHSSEATVEIEEIVNNIQLETNAVIKAMELGTQQVIEGTGLIQNTKQSLSQILDVCCQIDKLVKLISEATISQVQTSTEVTDLMKEIAQLSEMTSKASRQITTSMQHTVEISQKLQENVSIFEVS